MNVDELGETELLNASKLAEAAERYKDMCEFLHKLVNIKCDADKTLTVEERNLLSVAYKNVVGTKRQSWRMLTQGNFDQLPKEQLNDYRGTIEAELNKVCNEVIQLLKATTDVVKKKEETDSNQEDLVFYLKMSGDYYRYLSEVQTTESNQQTAEQFYKDATEVAEENLPETHPTRLGLALNYSVCCYEITEKKELACEIAKKAFDSAIEKLDTLNDSSYKDSTLIMQLLRDNLTLWTSEKEDAQDAE